jgi:hypothetical protein
VPIPARKGIEMKKVVIAALLFAAAASPAQAANKGIEST